LRSIEEAVADLRAKYEWRPSPELARMIKQLQAEIADRKAAFLKVRPQGTAALRLTSGDRMMADLELIAATLAAGLLNPIDFSQAGIQSTGNIAGRGAVLAADIYYAVLGELTKRQTPAPSTP
jgi:hypothetical protein